MSKGKFKAGVHPYEGKEFAASKEIKRLKGEEIMVFPMSQHIGALAFYIIYIIIKKVDKKKNNIDTQIN